MTSLCPKCGFPSTFSADGSVLPVRCPGCGAEFLPAADGAVAGRSLPVAPGAGWGGRSRLLVGLNVVTMTLLALGIAVFVNVMAAYRYERWDWTHSGTFTLTDQSRTFLRDLPKEVTIYFFPAVDPQDRLGGLVLQDLRDVLDTYAASTTKIHVDEVSPIRHPERVEEIQKQFALQALTPNDLLLVCENRRKLVNLSQCYQAGYQPTSATGPPVYTFRGEAVLTNAINAVLVEKAIRAYFVTGHGEASLGNVTPQGLSMFQTYLTGRELAEAQDLILHESGKIPDDGDVLVLVGPDEELPAAEIAMISDYLDRGGRLCLCLEPGSESGLEAVVKRWGVNLDDDYVCDLDRQVHIVDRPSSPAFFDVIEFGDHPVSSRLNLDTAPIFFRARSVEPSGKAPEGYRATSLLSTSKAPQGFAVRDFSAPPEYREGRDRAGPVSLGVAVEPVSSSPDRRTRLVVLGDADFSRNLVSSIQSPKRTELLVQAIVWLGGAESQLPVQRATEEDRSLSLTREETDRLALIVVVLIPGLAAFIGAVVWWMRRS